MVVSHSSGTPLPLRRGPHHHAWLKSEAERLSALTGVARVDAGFGWLDANCQLEPGPVATWITARMTHVAALAVLSGLTGGDGEVDQLEVAAHGVAALSGPLSDTNCGGWFATVGAEGPVDDAKRAYDHAFVLLAASSAMAADVSGSQDLMERVLSVLDEKFWQPREQMFVDSWDRAFDVLDDYRGINANMHMVEALLAAGEVTGDRTLIQRADLVAARVVNWAESNNWRIPEHFDAHWNVLLDYNREAAADPFRPYGATMGHGLEWARLLLHLDAAPGQASDRLSAAVLLYDRAVADGWAVDGADGFIYTADWDGRPVTRDRMHWVCCEAIAAAATLAERTGESRFEEDYERWWEFAKRYLLDLQGGSWHHALDARNVPDYTVWTGKPDLYHAVQACVLPMNPLAASVVAGIRSER